MSKDSEQPAPPAEPDPTDAAALQRDRDELFARLARVSAEFKNAQRRLEADMQQAVQYANSGLLKSLLPVIDNFERALAVDPAAADVNSILKGMHIVHDQWLAVLAAQDVQLIEPKPGYPFDPALHSAVTEEVDDKYKEPTVVRLFGRGYAMHGRTLRPAQVAVGRRADKSA